MAQSEERKVILRLRDVVEQPGGSKLELLVTAQAIYLRRERALAKLAAGVASFLAVVEIMVLISNIRTINSLNWQQFLLLATPLLLAAIVYFGADMLDSHRFMRRLGSDYTQLDSDICIPLVRLAGATVDPDTATTAALHLNEKSYQLSMGQLRSVRDLARVSQAIPELGDNWPIPPRQRIAGSKLAFYTYMTVGYLLYVPGVILGCYGVLVMSVVIFDGFNRSDFLRGVGLTLFGAAAGALGKLLTIRGARHRIPSEATP